MPPSEPDAPAVQERSGYWNEFYAKDDLTKRPLPSQFATFVAGELNSPRRLIDFGCGNGRDALFFSSLGHAVTGVDASSQAVEHCAKVAAALGEPAQFVASQIDDPALPGRIPDVDLPTVVYARFFLHAITEQEQAEFLTCAASLTAPGDVMAVEYRTVRDISNEKVTGSHYRRYLDPFAFQRDAASHGFEPTYAVEGFGYAKYLNDDAYVARCLLRRT
jgi:cyclopropane fatty-acyl-phospholipid synthase-like methyltransferase